MSSGRSGYIIVDSESTNFQEYHRNVAFSDRRLAFLDQYHTLPLYGSDAFWQTLETKGTPLEVLVRCIRESNAHGDVQARNRMLEILLGRTQRMNEEWVKGVSEYFHVSGDERDAFMHDLYADLYERVVRAVLDQERAFWEESFLHCLVFERKHTYTSFMIREGRWKAPETAWGKRIPRMYLARLGSTVEPVGEEALALRVENEYRHKIERRIEALDLFELVLSLPEELKAVILLVFWERHTEKEVASLLGITDRTVRNRISRAQRIMTKELQQDGEFTHG